MAAIALSRVVLRRVDSPSGRGIMPGAGDAPRARGVRARGRVSDGGDVCEVSPGRNDPTNAASDHSETPRARRPRAPRRPRRAPPDSWIRVVVDSVLLDDAPFEPPEGTRRARARAENFRSAGGGFPRTVRVLTAVLRTVTDEAGQAFLDASAFVLSPRTTTRSRRNERRDA